MRVGERCQKRHAACYYMTRGRSLRRKSLMMCRTTCGLQLLLLMCAIRSGWAQLSKPLASNKQLDPMQNKYWQRLATDDDRSEE